jgi:hypothetical protein
MVRHGDPHRRGRLGSVLFEIEFGIPEALIMLLVLFYSFAQFNAFRNLEGIPAPIYGGDAYHQLGSVYHVSQSGPVDWFSSSSFRGGLPICMPVYSIYLSLFVWFAGLPPIKSMFLSSFVFGFLAPVILHLILRRIFQDGFVAVAGVFTFLTLNKLPVFRYTNFAALLMTPVFAYALYSLFYRGVTKRSAIFFGLIFGLYSLSHTIGFIIALSFTAFFSVIHLLPRLIEVKLDKSGLAVETREMPPQLRKETKLLIMSIAVGVLLASLYWFKPIFVYMGLTPNDIQEWTFRDFGDDRYKWVFVENTLREFLIDFTSPHAAIKTLLAIAGLAILLDSRNKTDSVGFIRRFTAASALLSFSYFVTEPLFGTNFAPERIAPFTMGVSALLLMLLPLAVIKPKWLRGALIASLLLFASVEDFKAYSDVFQEGKFAYSTKLPSTLISAQEYVLANTGLNDVFLSTNEISFALNALTGRKVMITRRAHSDVFVDYDQRALDAAVILYGNNTQLKKELIQEYDIKYLLWTDYWINSEYPQTDSQCGSSGRFDPLVVLETPERVKIMGDNGVKYYQEHTWLDPSIEGEYVKKYDLIFVGPQNYRSFNRPWASDLDPYIIKVWSYTTAGKEIAALYEFNRTMMLSE